MDLNESQRIEQHAAQREEQQAKWNTSPAEIAALSQLSDAEVLALGRGNLKPTQFLAARNVVSR